MTNQKARKHVLGLGLNGSPDTLQQTARLQSKPTKLRLLEKFQSPLSQWTRHTTQAQPASSDRAVTPQGQ